MRIFIVRHGESEANVDVSVMQRRPDHSIPLTDKGHDQAVAAGEFIRNYICENDAYTFADRVGVWNRPPVGGLSVRVWNSPYTRARQTKDEMMPVFQASPINVSQRENVALCEKQFGLFDGLPWDERRRRYPREMDDYDKWKSHPGGRFWARYPLGESVFDVATRVQSFFNIIHRDYVFNEINALALEDVVVVCHGITFLCFVMQWMHYPYEWVDEQKVPNNCAVHLIDGNEDKGIIFKGFA